MMHAADAGSRPLVLVVDDDEPILRSMGRHLRDRYDVVLSTSGAQALDIAKDRPPAVVVLDVYMPDAHGIDVLVNMKATHPETPVIMHTAHGDVDLVVRAIKSGADDFVLKPTDLGLLDSKLSRALAGGQEKRRLRAAPPADRGLALDPQTAEALRPLELSPDTTVLLQGPTGIGKGALAALTHDDLPPHLNALSGSPDTPAGGLATLAEISRQHIERVLTHTGGQKAAAARILGINVSTLMRKLARSGAHGVS